MWFESRTAAVAIGMARAAQSAATAGVFAIPEQLDWALSVIARHPKMIHSMRGMRTSHTFLPARPRGARQLRCLSPLIGHRSLATRNHDRLASDSWSLHIGQRNGSSDDIFVEFAIIDLKELRTLNAGCVAHLLTVRLIETASLTGNARHLSKPTVNRAFFAGLYPAGQLTRAAPETSRSIPIDSCFAH